MVINTLSVGSEQGNNSAWLKTKPDTWVEQAAAVDGHIYYTSLAVLCYSSHQGRHIHLKICLILIVLRMRKEKRVVFLQLYIVTAHIRAGVPEGR